MLHVEAEQDDVAVGNHIFLALLADETLFLGGLHIAAAFVFQRIESDDFRLDKAALKIAVDFSGGLRRLGSLCNGPCPHFFFTRGEIADQPQKGIGFFDELGKPRFADAQLLDDLQSG